ncbi:hypothetical protein F4778DRAFT_732802 [Xylariomycetidae sp. FL2044]|nr:hypothetical protein F4778DRAFT_732802 [Xylariomycetidae sp. FL2044]
MAPSQPTILAALSAYRTHIGLLNHRAMSIMMPEIEAAIPEDAELFESEDELNECRLEFALRLIGADHATRPAITRPSDVLEHWEDLAPQVALDGAFVSRDADWRNAMRDTYMQGVVRGLNARCSDLVTRWEFPGDLAVVLDNVDSLHGPGWYKYRDEHETVVFFEGWAPDRVAAYRLTVDHVAGKVRTADEIVGDTVGVGERYEIAGGWVCGDIGNEAKCYVVYSRDRERAGEGEKEDWSWRYVACLGQFGTLVFGDVVELLEWYRSHQEPQMEDWSIDADEVFQP